MAVAKAVRLYLIGPRGSGKTTVGRLLAERLGYQFADADIELEARAGKSIADIFAAEGEEGFRRREAALVAELAGLDRHVIPCGGGVVLRPENRALLRTTGFCIWLTGEPATFYARLESDPATACRRPALTELSEAAEMERIVREREPLYREVAHLTVATDGVSPEYIVSTILSSCSTLGCTSR
jgi:shikimate kinase